MIFIAIIGIRDTIRSIVPYDVNKFKEMGIKLTMLTGDNKITS